MLQVRELRLAVAVLALYFICSLTSCGGGSMSSSSSGGSSSAPAGASPGIAAAGISGPVILVMEENHAYESVIGSSAMPYLNSLAHQGALATQYYADVHHSLPDYLELTMGAIPTMDDNYPGVFTQDNLAREIVAAGKTWKTYQEDLPSAGYLGGDTAGYIRHHNPFAYFSDVANDAGQTARIVPFTQFAADLNSNSLPSFSFVVPSRIHDAHDCGSGAACSDTDLLSQADQWLQANIAPVLGNAQFQNGGLLLIVFDEANLADIRHGGGRVPLIAVGPKARPGAQSATFYQHENTLRTICNLLGLSACPGSGASAAPESDLLR